MTEDTTGGNPPEEGTPAETAPEEPSASDSGASGGFYQGKPVLVLGGSVYALPAPLPIGPESVTQTAEEYDAGAEAESATTPETAGVTQDNV